jgi:hypothetical protein
MRELVVVLVAASAAALLARWMWDALVTKWLLWLVMDSGIPLGRAGPWVFALAIGRWPHKRPSG